MMIMRALPRHPRYAMNISFISKINTRNLEGENEIPGRARLCPSRKSPGTFSRMTEDRHTIARPWGLATARGSPAVEKSIVCSYTFRNSVSQSSGRDFSIPKKKIPVYLTRITTLNLVVRF